MTDRRVFDFLLAFAVGAVVALILAPCFGCAGAPETREPPPPVLSAALAALGAPEGSGAPSLRWREGSAECAGVAWVEGGRCVRGMQNGDRIDVATWSGAAASQTSLAHESLHWLLWTQGVDSREHGGDFYQRVEAANRELWQSGR